MEYKDGQPITKEEREARRQHERKRINEEHERNRQASKSGDQLDDLGITQGQNAEQGNTTDPRKKQPIGRPGSEG